MVGHRRPTSSSGMRPSVLDRTTRAIKKQCLALNSDLGGSIMYCNVVLNVNGITWLFAELNRVQSEGKGIHRIVHYYLLPALRTFYRRRLQRAGAAHIWLVANMCRENTVPEKNY